MPTTILHDISQEFSNGVIIAPRFTEGLEGIKARVAKWGLVGPSLLAQVVEFALWYLGVGLYGMTVVYILFLRKTVYDI